MDQASTGCGSTQELALVGGTRDGQTRDVGLMVHFMSQLGWAPGCLDIGSKLSCDAFFRVFITETNI